jgi:hypothetical protein
MAPDLTFARARLGPGWVIRWFEGPNQLQPGTRMPTFWSVENGVRSVLDESIGNAEREMQLLRDYLFAEEFPGDYSESARRLREGR